MPIYQPYYLLPPVLFYKTDSKIRPHHPLLSLTFGVKRREAEREQKDKRE
jgi:hypothetical protein